MMGIRGVGVVVPLVTLGCLVVAELASETLFQDEAYYQEHGWPMALGFVASGVLMRWIAPRLLNGEGRVVVNRETGERIVAGEPVHLFLFLPPRLWTPLLFALGAAASLLPPLRV